MERIIFWLKKKERMKIQRSWRSGLNNPPKMVHCSTEQVLPLAEKEFMRLLEE